VKINNKAFTLIELLAVIVILAIIALIATPIVLNIISNTKENAQLRSAEMYLDAVEQSVMMKKMQDTTFNPNSCEISDKKLYCNESPEELKVEVNGEKPNSGSIIFTSGKINDIELTYTNGKTIGKDTKGDLVYLKKFKDICKYANNGVAEKTAGAKYTCEVKPETSYTFYILSTPAEGATSINLIMDQNINSDGTPAGMTGTTKSGENVYNLVAWNNESGQKTNAYGPVTAMNFLYNATKDWVNVDPLNYIYKDREIQKNNDGEGYISFISTNGVAKIKPLDTTKETVTIGSETTPLRARMPIYASDASITEVTSKTNASYLYDNLDPDGMSKPYGYWTLSSNAGYSPTALFVYSSGFVSSGNVYADTGYGVRPVITLKL